MDRQRVAHRKPRRFVSSAQPGQLGSASIGLSDPNNLATSLSTDGSTFYVATGSNGIHVAARWIAWSPYSGSGDAVVAGVTCSGSTAAAVRRYGGGVAAVGASTGKPTHHTTTHDATSPHHHRRQPAQQR